MWQMFESPAKAIFSMELHYIPIRFKMIQSTNGYLARINKIVILTHFLLKNYHKPKIFNTFKHTYYMLNN